MESGPQPAEVNLARGVMMGLFATLEGHRELDPIVTMLALRGCLDEQLDLMMSQYADENPTNQNEEDND
jgi:hypothetical protein